MVMKLNRDDEEWRKKSCDDLERVFITCFDRMHKQHRHQVSLVFPVIQPEDVGGTWESRKELCRENYYAGELR
jgi:hypothetical protein